MEPYWKRTPFYCTFPFLSSSSWTEGVCVNKGVKTSSVAIWVQRNFTQSSCKELSLTQGVNCFERKKNEKFRKKIQVSIPAEEAEREPDYHINSSVRVRVWVFHSELRVWPRCSCVGVLFIVPRVCIHSKHDREEKTHTSKLFVYKYSEAGELIFPCSVAP